MTADHIPHTFQVDLRGLVDLLSHHLYSSPRVYLRELLQNAVDAITARAITLFTSLGDPARHDHTGAQLMAAWLESDLGRGSAAGVRARAVLEEYGDEGEDENDTELTTSRPAAGPRRGRCSITWTKGLQGIKVLLPCKPLGGYLFHQEGSSATSLPGTAVRVVLQEFLGAAYQGLPYSLR
nr:hypothetical protein OG690_33555 [Streptomyces tubercidicus]